MRGLSVVCLLGFVAGAAGAAEPPSDVAAAVAIAKRLAGAAPKADQAALAAEADRLAVMPSAWILSCLDPLATATPGGANWLRTALERVADRPDATLPLDDVAAFVSDTARPARARSLAYGWLRERAPDRAAAMLDGMLDDPALDLRRAAVERLLGSTASADDDARKATHRRALAAARDVDQIEGIAGWLAEHGERVDVAEVLGFVRRWQVSEAFDNVKGVGFATAYPPEQPASTTDTATWKSVTSTDKHGAIDLNAAVATRKGVAAYAVAAVEMPRAGRAEVRIGSPCAVIVWVNGERVMAHEIYHASEAIDQYVAPAEFRAGPNTVLVKCCQNEQTESWAADWKFQLRICDPLGTPLATQPAEEKTP